MVRVGLAAELLSLVKDPKAARGSIRRQMIARMLGMQLQRV
jgi:hypothetical protein